MGKVPVVGLCWVASACRLTLPQRGRCSEQQESADSHWAHSSPVASSSGESAGTASWVASALWACFTRVALSSLLLLQEESWLRILLCSLVRPCVGDSWGWLISTDLGQGDFFYKQSRYFVILTTLKNPAEL